MEKPFIPEAEIEGESLEEALFLALAVLSVMLGTARLIVVHPAHAEPPDPCRYCFDDR
jgi:hypothetical protein